MLFIDNPVGTGYSFTDPDGYTKSIQQVSDHLHIALVQFLKLFPEYRESPFFITGESFAGKYIPGIAHKIYEMNERYDNVGHGEFKINLEGIALGNAFTDPINMMDYSSFAYENGLVDIHGRREMEMFEILTKENIDSGRGKLVSEMGLSVNLSVVLNDDLSSSFSVLGRNSLLLPCQQ